MINIAIIGAGLMGRLIALSLSRQGYEITLIDKDNKQAHNSAAYAAAGLLTPLGEALHCAPNIVEMGFESLKLWPTLLATFEQPVFFQQRGAIMVSHAQDQGDFQHFARFIKAHYSQYQMNGLSRSQLEALEPDVGQAFSQGVFLPDEGQINNRELLTALADELAHSDVQWLSGTNVIAITPSESISKVTYVGINDVELTQTFDLTIDCRGVGAKENNDNKPNDLSDLRAVRGEVFRLYAPEVTITRPIRLMHPRYQLYIAPKGKGHFTVGATEIESDDMSPMTVRSAMELLSAAYSVHSGFAEANITEHLSQCRPAFSDNQPKILLDNTTIHVNGLYRHGYLISPVVLAQVEALVAALVKSGCDNYARRDSDYSHFTYSHLLPISVSAVN